MKRKSQVLSFALLLAFVAPVYSATPNVEFSPDGVTVLNVRPGAKVEWISLTRTPVANHSRLRIDRGIAVANASRKANVIRAGADQSRSLWVVAGIDDEIAGSAIPAGYASSPIPIHAVAKVGSATITVTSPEVELMYVRPKRGAWFVSAADGGLNDLDGQHDASIVISMQNLERVEGNPHPPDASDAGDLLLMIDPRTNRIAVVKVVQ